MNYSFMVFYLVNDILEGTIKEKKQNGIRRCRKPLDEEKRQFERESTLSNYMENLVPKDYRTVENLKKSRRDKQQYIRSCD